MSERRECHVCGRGVRLTAAGKYWAHKCPAAGTFPPDAGPPPPPPDTPEIPGTTPYVRELGAAVGELARRQFEDYGETVANATPFAQPSGGGGEQMPFSQPGGNRRKVATPKPMTELGQEIAARLKEMFHGYTNRMERNQQQTMGPSEIGSPCDRRIAMSLLRFPRVNPGGDNWASFLGTCMHAGLEDMFLWADAGSGRYATELPLRFPSKFVPKGTGDLLDRTLCVFLDHKGMGTWSLNKLRTDGPSRQYRVQVHTYAYGARLAGEDVEHVAIVGWPRQGKDLSDLYVWTEPYDPAVARDALDRVDRIGADIAYKRDHLDSDAEVANSFPIAEDCRFCPFHKPGAHRSEGGVCNGRQ